MQCNTKFYGILDLPDDVIHNIAERCGTSCALRLSECCSDLHHIVHKQQLWRLFCDQEWRREEQNFKAFNNDYLTLYRNANGWFPLTKVYVIAKVGSALTSKDDKEIIRNIQTAARTKSFLEKALQQSNQNDEGAAMNQHVLRINSWENIDDTTSCQVSRPAATPVSSSSSRQTRCRLKHRCTLSKSFSDPNLDITQSISQSAEPRASSRIKRHRRKALLEVASLKKNISVRYQIKNNILHCRALRKSPRHEENKVKWIPSTPKFQIYKWFECPNNENIMDARLIDNLLISVTAGWHVNMNHWIPPHPHFMKSNNNYIYSSDLMSENTNESIIHHEHSSLQELRGPLLQRNTADIESNICIRNVNTLELIQRINYPTPCINCVDSGVNCADPSMFVIGDDSGRISLLRRSDHKFELILPTLMTRAPNTNLTSSHLLMENDAPYHQYSTKEVNDVRLTIDSVVIAVRTFTRYPSCLELYDLHTQNSEFYPPIDIENFWVHAVELTNSGDAADLIAVGESSVNGIFAILGLDFRTRRKVTSVCPQARQMIWPLRVCGNYIFGNAVVPVNDVGGFLTQFDRRRMTQENSRSLSLHSRTRNLSLGSSSSNDRHYQVLQRPTEAVSVYPCGSMRVEDIRCLHDHLYVYGLEGSNLCLDRSNFHLLGHRKRLTDVDFFDTSVREGNILKLFQCNERGWIGTCGSRVYRGKIIYDTT